jgi:transporter family protein
MNSWQLFAFGSAVFAALTAIFGKIGVADINSNLATWIRTIVILLVLSAIVTFRQEWPKDLSGISKHALAFLILSGIATGLSWLCYYRALQLGPASRVAPVDKLSVAIAILLALVFLGEKLTWKVALGGTLITLGSIVMAFA